MVPVLLSSPCSRPCRADGPGGDGGGGRRWALGCGWRGMRSQGWIRPRHAALACEVAVGLGLDSQIPSGLHLCLSHTKIGKQSLS